jgi:hypothetical protein
MEIRRIEAVYDGNGTAVTKYKVVDEKGNVEFCGDYSDCMEIIHETKYLVFYAEKNVGRKTNIIHIINKSSTNELATIEWYGAWRQYCFIPNLEFDTVWNNTCLADVISVINQLMKERQIEKSKGE